MFVCLQLLTANRIGKNEYKKKAKETSKNKTKEKKTHKWHEKMKWEKYNTIEINWKCFYQCMETVVQ